MDIKKDDQNLNESEAFGNKSYQMNIAFMRAYDIQEIIEKLEPTEDEVFGYLTELNASLYSETTELGKKLAGDSVLALEGFVEITGNDPRLIQLVGLFLASDALKGADASLLGESRLTLDQLHGGGYLLEDICHEIIVENPFGLIGNRELGKRESKFDKELKDRVESYREQGILHASKDAVKAAIK